VITYTCVYIIYVSYIHHQIHPSNACTCIHLPIHVCTTTPTPPTPTRNDTKHQHWDEGWRISYGGKGVFSVLLMVLMLWLPESPRWLVAQDRDEEVRGCGM
jgi:hypothetical protein